MKDSGHCIETFLKNCSASDVDSAVTEKTVCLLDWTEECVSEHSCCPTRASSLLQQRAGSWCHRGKATLPILPTGPQVRGHPCVCFYRRIVMAAVKAVEPRSLNISCLGLGHSEMTCSNCHINSFSAPQSSTADTRASGDGSRFPLKVITKHPAAFVWGGVSVGIDRIPFPLTTGKLDQDGTINTSSCLWLRCWDAMTSYPSVVNEACWDPWSGYPSFLFSFPSSSLTNVLISGHQTDAELVRSHLMLTYDARK